MPGKKAALLEGLAAARRAGVSSLPAWPPSIQAEPETAAHEEAADDQAPQAETWAEPEPAKMDEPETSGANDSKPVAELVPVPVDGELRIRDLELANRLKYGENRDRGIRKLIARHRGALSQMGVLPEIEEIIGKGQKTKAFYLNRKQAIFITAKSETPEATDITIEVIERFDAYERGAHPSQVAGAMSNEVTAMLKMMSEAIAGIPAAMVAALQPLLASRAPPPDAKRSDPGPSRYDARRRGERSIREFCSDFNFPEKEFRHVWLAGLIERDEVAGLWKCTDRGLNSGVVTDRPLILYGADTGRMHAVLTKLGADQFKKKLLQITRFKKGSEDNGRQSDLYPDHPDDPYNA